MELGSAALLIVGRKRHWAAVILALFCVAAAVLFHNLWAFPKEAMYGQTSHVFKNFAPVGGLIALAYQGAGALSLDAMTEGRRRRPAAA